MSDDKTYVYKETEVKLTGRTAEKEIKGLRKGTPSRVAVLHEITPVDSLNGSWKKWVQMVELFEIM
jgi:hypothetical protein